MEELSRKYQVQTEKSKDKVKSRTFLLCEKKSELSVALGDAGAYLYSP